MHPLIPDSLKFLPNLYAVGGAVRDWLLGKTPDDIDLATSARPEEVMRLCSERGLRVVPTGMVHGTVTVLLDVPYEVTTFRRDVETDGRNATVAFAQRIEDDLSRRDFTINAIALDVEENLVDPFGGRDDLRAKILRTVGDPYQRFREDYLRIIRAVRMSVRFGLPIEEQTGEAMYALAPRVLKHVSIERIVAEFDKAFAYDHSGAFVRGMYDLGLLQQLIPEFAGTDQLLQNPRYHPEGDVLTHVCEVVDRTPSAYRWHALLHDIGKGPTAKLKPEGYYSFHGHEYAGAERIPRIAKDLKLPGDLRDALVITTELHMVPAFTPAKPAAIRRFQARAGEHLEALEAVCRADAGYSESQAGINSRRPDSAWKFFEPQTVPIKPILQGRDLLERGHQPGKEFSRMLKAAYEYQLREGVMDRELLYEIAKKEEGGKRKEES